MMPSLCVFVSLFPCVISQSQHLNYHKFVATNRRFFCYGLLTEEVSGRVKIVGREEGGVGVGGWNDNAERGRLYFLCA